jgi:hypothetical protein
VRSKRVAAAQFALVSTVFLSPGARANVDHVVVRSMPLSYLTSLESVSPGSVENWLKGIEARSHGKISAETHDETGFVDLNCFNCDVHEFDSAIQLASPKNDFISTH